MLAFCFAHGIQPGATFLVASRGEHAMELRDSAPAGARTPFSIDIEKAFHIRYED
jgi:hypothetical protein